MNYPHEIWADTDLVCDDKPHDGWQKYRIVDDVPRWVDAPIRVDEIPPGMKLARLEMQDGKSVRCFIEDKPSNDRTELRLPGSAATTTPKYE
jgi:hypothetical protein